MEKKIVKNEKIGFKDFEKVMKPLRTVVDLVKKRIDLDDLNIVEEAFFDSDGKLDKIKKAMDVVSIANNISIKEEEFGNTTKKVLTFWGEGTVTGEEYGNLIKHSNEDINKLPSLKFVEGKSKEELGELAIKAKMSLVALVALIRFCEQKFRDVDGIIEETSVSTISKIIESAIIALLKISSILEDEEEISNVYDVASFLFRNIRGVSLDDLNYKNIDEGIVYLFSIDNIVFLNTKSKGLREALDREKGELEYGHIAGGSDMILQGTIDNNVESIIANKELFMNLHVIESTISGLTISPAASKVFADALQDRGFSNDVYLYDNYDVMYDKLIESFEDDNLKLYSRIFKNIIGDNGDKEIMLINHVYKDISKELISNQY